jgi:hypothetical protein
MRGAYILTTTEGRRDMAPIERAAKRSFGRRGFVLTVLRVSQAEARQAKIGRRIAFGEQWALWWNSPDPEPLEGEKLLDAIEDKFG